ncbi:Rpn family recombination-promoting nuclease/putative transposase [Virgibacillus siamensis]|uniref:Rpn family recombination-promoting nuclease/putative transposase n=1 Tax=Virgibacillus siamensis TaxID=480071 RepID=A0ABP3QVA8_9BACI
MVLTEYTAPVYVKENSCDYSKLKGGSKENGTKLLKRIPLAKLMDLKVDYAFKQLFGNEKNKDITVVFLNAILQKTGRSKIKDISFGNTDLANEYLDDKASRLDLLVVTDADEWIDVEIQFANKYDMVERSLFYWSRMYQQPLEKSMPYSQLRPVIAINILNYDLFSETENFHTSFHLYEDGEKFKLTDLMEIHFIEMGKLILDWKNDKLNPRDDILVRWLLMLGMVDRRTGKDYEDIYSELEEISMDDESLRNAFQNWEELSMTQEQRMAYEARFKRIMDEEAFRRSMEIKQQEIEESKQEMEESKQEMEESKQEMEQSERRLAKKEQEVELSKRELEKFRQELNQSHQELKQSKQVYEQNVKKEVALNLLKKGTEVRFVVESTGLPEEVVFDIQCNSEVE